MVSKTKETYLIASHGEANQVLGRTVWSTPQIVMDARNPTRRVSCATCQFFADSKARVSALALRPDSMAHDDAMTFGWCKNLRIWAAFGKENAPITRSYHYCNFHKEKEKESGT